MQSQRVHFRSRCSRFKIKAAKVQKAHRERVEGVASSGGWIHANLASSEDLRKLDLFFWCNFHATYFAIDVSVGFILRFGSKRARLTKRDFATTSLTRRCRIPRDTRVFRPWVFFPMIIMIMMLVVNEFSTSFMDTYSMVSDDKSLYHTIYIYIWYQKYEIY